MFEEIKTTATDFKVEAQRSTLIGRLDGRSVLIGRVGCSLKADWSDELKWALIGRMDGMLMLIGPMVGMEMQSEEIGDRGSVRKEVVCFVALTFIFFCQYGGSWL